MEGHFYQVSTESHMPQCHITYIHTNITQSWSQFSDVVGQTMVAGTPVCLHLIISFWEEKGLQSLQIVVILKVVIRCLTCECCFWCVCVCARASSVPGPYSLISAPSQTPVCALAGLQFPAT